MIKEFSRQQLQDLAKHVMPNPSRTEEQFMIEDWLRDGEIEGLAVKHILVHSLQGKGVGLEYLRRTMGQLQKLAKAAVAERWEKELLTTFCERYGVQRQTDGTIERFIVNMKAVNMHHLPERFLS